MIERLLIKRRSQLRKGDKIVARNNGNRDMDMFLSWIWDGKVFTDLNGKNPVDFNFINFSGAKYIVVERDTETTIKCTVTGVFGNQFGF